MLGLNENHGTRILLRIRTDDLQGFRKLLTIKEVLCHELAHMVHSEHGDEFYILMRQLQRELVELDWTRSRYRTLGHTIPASYEALEAKAALRFPPPPSPAPVTVDEGQKPTEAEPHADDADEMRKKRLVEYIDEALVNALAQEDLLVQSPSQSQEKLVTFLRSCRDLAGSSSPRESQSLSAAELHWILTTLETIFTNIRETGSFDERVRTLKKSTRTFQRLTASGSGARVRQMLEAGGFRSEENVLIMKTIDRGLVYFICDFLHMMISVLDQ